MSYPRGKRGDFWWCVDNLDLGDRKLTVIARFVCERWNVWPEQLVGRPYATPATSEPDNPPLATGRVDRACRGSHFALARRHAWCLAREFTDFTADELGRRFGGFSASAVYDAWRRVDEFVTFPGPALLDRWADRA